jgi:hypothetical protein
MEPTPLPEFQIAEHGIVKLDGDVWNKCTSLRRVHGPIESLETPDFANLIYEDQQISPQDLPQGAVAVGVFQLRGGAQTLFVRRVL